MDDNDNNRMNDETSKQNKTKYLAHKNDERNEKINCLRKQEEKKRNCHSLNDSEKKVQ